MSMNKPSAHDVTWSKPDIVDRGIGKGGGAGGGGRSSGVFYDIGTRISVARANLLSVKTFYDTSTKIRMTVGGFGLSEKTFFGVGLKIKVKRI